MAPAVAGEGDLSLQPSQPSAVELVQGTEFCHREQFVCRVGRAGRELSLRSGESASRAPHWIGRQIRGSLQERRGGRDAATGSGPVGRALQLRGDRFDRFHCSVRFRRGQPVRRFQQPDLVGSRTVKTTATRPAWRRRATEARVCAETRSSQCASSTRAHQRLLLTCGGEQTQHREPHMNRSGRSPVFSPNAVAEAARCGSGSHSRSSLWLARRLANSRSSASHSVRRPNSRGAGSLLTIGTPDNETTQGSTHVAMAPQTPLGPGCKPVRTDRLSDATDVTYDGCVLIAEDLLLLLTDDHTGKLVASSSHVDVALGGALLIELTLMERVDIADSDSRVRKGRLVVKDTSPTGDSLLDEAVATVGQKENKKPQSVVGALGKRTRMRLYERLVNGGVLRAEDRRALGIFPSRRWLPGDAGRETSVRADTVTALRHGATTDARIGALVSLLLALDAVHKVVDLNAVGLSKREAKTNAKQIAEGDWAAKAVRQAIDSMNAAVVAAITSAAVVGGSSGS